LAGARKTEKEYLFMKGNAGYAMAARRCHGPRSDLRFLINTTCLLIFSNQGRLQRDLP